MFRSLRRRVRLPRQLKFTREGKYFVGITLGIGFAAINTGNNLLYLLLGMMLSLIVISSILSEWSLKSLEVKRQLPSQLSARTPGLVTLAITNNKKRLPSFSIELEDQIEGIDKSKSCYFLKLSPGKEQRAAYRLELPRRGLYRFQEIKVSTGFPFSLFVKSRRLTITDELIVFPAIRFQEKPGIGYNQQRQGQVSSNAKGQGSDFFNLREHQQGDELRHIHWPSSARTQQLQVREFQDEHKPQVDLLLWNAPPSTGEYAEEQLDEAIELAASYVAAFLREGRPVQFATAQSTFPPIQGQQSFHTLLRHLALLGPQAPQSPTLDSPQMLLVLPESIPAPALHATPRIVTVNDALPPAQENS